MDSYRLSKRTEEQEAVHRASQRLEIIESLNSEIDSVVRNASHRLEQNEGNLIRKWAADMKAQLGTDGIQPFVQALRKADVEEGIMLAIRKFRDEVRYAETANSIFNEDRSAILPQFQPRHIIDQDYERSRLAGSAQRSLRHSSRILGRHAQILGVETRGDARDGGYWLQQA